MGKRHNLSLVSWETKNPAFSIPPSPPILLPAAPRVVAAERRGSLREDKGGFLLLFQSPLLESPPQAPRRGQFSCSSPTPSGLTTLGSSALGMDTNIHPNTYGGLAVSPVELEETSLYSVFPLAYNNKLGKCRNNG